MVNLDFSYDKFGVLWVHYILQEPLPMGEYADYKNMGLLLVHLNYRNQCGRIEDMNYSEIGA